MHDLEITITQNKVVAISFDLAPIDYHFGNTPMYGLGYSQMFHHAMNTNTALFLSMLDYSRRLGHFGQHYLVVVALNRVSNLHAIKGAADVIDGLLYCFIS